MTQHKNNYSAQYVKSFHDLCGFFDNIRPLYGIVTVV